MTREAHRYAYTVESYYAGAGRCIWRWIVNDGHSGTAVVCGVSLQSQEAAEQAALHEIARRR